MIFCIKHIFFIYSKNVLCNKSDHKMINSKNMQSKMKINDNKFDDDLFENYFFDIENKSHF